MVDWNDDWTSMVALRSELDQVEYEQELEASHDEDDDVRVCQWCGLIVNRDPFVNALTTVGFSLKEYWGPLEFDESDRHRWRVALFIGEAWRWMDLDPPPVPGARHEVSQPLCSDDCCEAFMRALRRDTAKRRPQ